MHTYIMYLYEFVCFVFCLFLGDNLCVYVYTHINLVICIVYRIYIILHVYIMRYTIYTCIYIFIVLDIRVAKSQTVPMRRATAKTRAISCPSCQSCPFKCVVPTVLCHPLAGPSWAGPSGPGPHGPPIQFCFSFSPGLLVQSN